MRGARHVLLQLIIDRRIVTVTSTREQYRQFQQWIEFSEHAQNRSQLERSVLENGKDPLLVFPVPFWMVRLVSQAEQIDQKPPIYYRKRTIRAFNEHGAIDVVRADGIGIFAELNSNPNQETLNAELR